MLEDVRLLALLAVAGAAAVSDVRSARIPNALTLTGLLAGLALAAGTGTLGSSGLAAGAAFGLGSLLFGARVLGGGDVKLMIAVAALLGLDRFLLSLLLTAVAGAALSLLVATRRGVLLPVLHNAKDTVVSWTTPGNGPPGGAVRTGIGIPYGVAIAAGAVGAWFA